MVAKGARLPRLLGTENMLKKNVYGPFKRIANLSSRLKEVSRYTLYFITLPVNIHAFKAAHLRLTAGWVSFLILDFYSVFLNSKREQNLRRL